MRREGLGAVMDNGPRWAGNEESDMSTSRTDSNQRALVLGGGGVAGIAWETFHTTGESTDYGDGTGENRARIAQEKQDACCAAQAASKPSTACC